MTASQWSLRQWLRSGLILLFFFYFGFHMLHGERGVYALLRMNRQHVALEHELASLKENRERLEQRVHHLQSSSLDRDLLDEQVRKMLGTTAPGEVVLFSDSKTDTE